MGYGEEEGAGAAPGSAVGSWQLSSDSVTMANCLVLSALTSSTKWDAGAHTDMGKLVEIRAPTQHRTRHLAAENRLNLLRGLAGCWGRCWEGAGEGAGEGGSLGPVLTQGALISRHFLSDSAGLLCRRRQHTCGSPSP